MVSVSELHSRQRRDRLLLWREERCHSSRRRGAVSIGWCCGRRGNAKGRQIELDGDDKDGDVGLSTLYTVCMYSTVTLTRGRESQGREQAGRGSWKFGCVAGGRPLDQHHEQHHQYCTVCTGPPPPSHQSSRGTTVNVVTATGRQSSVTGWSDDRTRDCTASLYERRDLIVALHISSSNAGLSNLETEVSG
nr:hypothetical protein CFP56_33553 [Quercus suber]